jgi:uncharacterized protein
VNAARILAALAAGAARRPRAVVLIAVALGLAGGALALRLQPAAGADTLVGRSSATYQATQRYYRRFGDDAVIVLVKGSLRQLVLTQDIERELGLEGCISGKVPAQAIASFGGAKGPCGQLARAHAVRVVFGPGTFINEAVGQISDQLTLQTQQAAAQAQRASQLVYRAALARHDGVAQARRLALAASRVVELQYVERLLQTGERYGITSPPSLNDPAFITRLVFDSSKPAGTPKERFAYLFPTPDSAIVSVRLNAGLSESQRTRAIGLIRQAVAMPAWRLAHGESYLVTGVPVIVSDLTDSITASIRLLLVAVLLVMAATLALIFGCRPRLLPLGVALLAAALAFGALAVSGASLTMASIGVLPVLVGLAVDYSIQFQSRVEEARAGSRAAGPGSTGALVSRAAAVGGPTIATAAAATAGGLLVLALSPVPMVRGFGLLLVAGLVLAVLCAFTAGSAALVLAERFGRRGRRGLGARGPARALAGWLGAAWRGARELLLDNPVSRGVTRTALSYAPRHPGRVLGIGLALAVVGWGLGTQTRVETNIQKLVPQNLASLRNLNTLERATGVGGEIDVMVSADDLTRPQVVDWMTAYQGNLLRRFGYTPTRGCGRAQLCPAFSLPDLFAYAGQSGQTPNLSQADIRGLLDAVPAYFSQGVITPDRRTATLAFGIRLMPLDQQERVIAEMRRGLQHRPPGVTAELVGLPVLAADANAQVSSVGRRMLTMLAGLAAVALVLLVAFRGDRRRALVPLIPIVLATGWSALLLFAIRIPLNPMSVTLGALVIAITTEFSVLLSERYRHERIAGHGPRRALARTYRSTGAAVVASAATAIAGFAVLVLSDIQMLRGFGFVTVIDLTASLLGVMVVLPAALLLAERGELARLPLSWIEGATARVRTGGRARHEPA